ncbi:hypothetical protein NW759_002653 [Fusarium solani]|nr:hypothetical protein NW759_002653 [Fusarium solani]
MSSSVDAKAVGLNQIAKGEEHQILREVLYAAAGRQILGKILLIPYTAAIRCMARCKNAKTLDGDASGKIDKEGCALNHEVDIADQKSLPTNDEDATNDHQQHMNIDSRHAPLPLRSA